MIRGRYDDQEIWSDTPRTFGAADLPVREVRNLHKDWCSRLCDIEGDRVATDLRVGHCDRGCRVCRRCLALGDSLPILRAARRWPNIPRRRIHIPRGYCLEPVFRRNSGEHRRDIVEWLNDGRICDFKNDPWSRLRDLFQRRIRLTVGNHLLSDRHVVLHAKHLQVINTKIELRLIRSARHVREIALCVGGAEGKFVLIDEVVRRCRGSFEKQAFH